MLLAESALVLATFAALAALLARFAALLALTAALDTKELVGWASDIEDTSVAVSLAALAWLAAELVFSLVTVLELFASLAELEAWLA